MQLYGGDRIAHICVIIAEIDAWHAIRVARVRLAMRAAHHDKLVIRGTTVIIDSPTWAPEPSRTIRLVVPKLFPVITIS